MSKTIKPKRGVALLSRDYGAFAILAGCVYSCCADALKIAVDDGSIDTAPAAVKHALQTLGPDYDIPEIGTNPHALALAAHNAAKEAGLAADAAQLTADEAKANAEAKGANDPNAPTIAALAAEAAAEAHAVADKAMAEAEAAANAVG